MGCWVELRCSACVSEQCASVTGKVVGKLTFATRLDAANALGGLKSSAKRHGWVFQGDRESICPACSGKPRGETK